MILLICVSRSLATKLSELSDLMAYLTYLPDGRGSHGITIISINR
jgi:hypothetical protein